MRRRCLLALLALLTVAACAPGDPGSPEGTLRVAQAAVRTAEANSARMSMTTVFADSPAMAGAGEMTAEGTVDFTGNRGHITMHVPLPPEAGGDQTMEMIFDDMVMYMQVPTPGMPSWMRFDLSEAGFDELGQLGGNDPTASLSYLHGAGEPELLGEEDVRGSPTTRYRVTADLEQALDEVGERGRELVQQTISQLGTTTFPMEVWLDVDDRVRRMRWSIDLSTVQPGASGTMEQTIEYYDFGVDVELTLPPEDQVVDMTPEMLEQMQQAPAGG